MSDDEIPKLPVHYVAARRALAKCRSIRGQKEARRGVRPCGLCLQGEGSAVDGERGRGEAAGSSSSIAAWPRKSALGSWRRGRAANFAGPSRANAVALVRLLAGSSRPRATKKEKNLEDYGIDKTLAKQIRKVGDLTPEQVEQDVARVPRLAVASIEDGSDHVIRGQDIEKATVLDIVSDGGW